MNQTAPISTVNLYAFGLFYASVCVPADLAQSDVERAVNAEHPTGIDSPWKISRESFADGNPNPRPCEHDPARLHYLLSC